MLEHNLTYNCDCLVGLTRLQDESVDMVITSPPYDDLRKYGGAADGWGWSKFELVAEQLYRVLKKGGVIVWVCGDETKEMSESGTSFKTALHFMKVGFKLYDTMLYHKINPLPTNHKRYEQAFEYMFVLSKGEPNTFNGIKEKTKGVGKQENWFRETTPQERMARRSREVNDIQTRKEDKLHTNIFSYAVGGEQTGHPAPFPLQLAKDQIYTWSNEGDLILDIFMGSGTSGIAAVELKRDFIGFELNARYVDIARKRVEPYLKQLKLF